MLTVLEIIKRTTDFFQKHGVESARLNAELLIGHALRLKRMQLYLQFERPLTEVELEQIRPLVKRRSNREPLQYIIGETEFCGLKLKVDRRALIPRPETEYLVELLGGKLTTPPRSILDLGTGTGALALALAEKFPASVVTAVDKNPEALALARENAEALKMTERVRLLPSDWFSALPMGEKFQLIVANPPYLTEAEVKGATPEVKDHEPVSALIAAREGRADLEHIITHARSFLVEGGLLACETGIAQHAQLIEQAKRDGYARTESLRDLTDRDRYLLAFL
ncbi:MAG TPA: peptide chain release factor N(5)-glutamine methyltransferase [Lacunisphaera sp.]